MTCTRTLSGLVTTIVAAALCSSAFAETIVFADSDFDLENWSTTSGRFGAGGTAEFSQVAGNPGTARQVRHLVQEPGPATVAEFHALNGATYNPAGSGEIVLIEFSMDYLNVATENPPTVGMSLRLAIKQGDSYFTAEPSSGTGSVMGWQSVKTSYAEANFGMVDLDGFRVVPNEDVQPDFSSSGAEIQFGFLTQNSDSTSGGVTDDRTAAFDNFNVTITTADCPEDLDGDGEVGSSDLAILLAAWGACD